MSMVDLPAEGDDGREDAAGPTAGFAQPLVGLLGLLWVGVVFVVLGIVPGAETSVQVLGPVTTFMLPLLILVAVWWGGWPGSGMPRAAGGVVNTLLVAGAAVLLTALAQPIVGRADLDGLFRTAAAGAQGHFTSFPWLVPVAALVFVTMLQLTFVNGQWPLAALGRLGGPAALLVSLVVGFVVYALFANWDFVPGPVQHALGLSNPGGSVTALHLVAWALCLALWQAILFVLLQGQPFAGIASQGARLLTANVATLAIAWLTYFLFKDAFDWPVERIAGVCGSAIAGIFIATMLTDGWAARWGGPLGVVAVAVLAAVAFFFGIRALGNAVADWKAVPVELWVGISGLNYVAAVVIAHCVLWRRWPIPLAAPR